MNSGFVKKKMNRAYLFITALILSLSFSTVAHTAQKNARWNAPLRLLTLLPVAAAGHILVHESFHALAARGEGWSILSFQPYPHIQDDLGGFVFGSMSYYVTARGPTLTMSTALVAVAPYIYDVSVFALSDALLHDSRIANNPWARSALFLAGMLIPWLDFTFHFTTTRPGTDLAKFRAAIGDRGTLAFNITGAALITLGAWRLFARALEF